jgi:hypothetical protein
MNGQRQDYAAISLGPKIGNDMLNSLHASEPKASSKRVISPRSLQNLKPGHWGQQSNTWLAKAITNVLDYHGQISTSQIIKCCYPVMLAEPTYPAVPYTPPKPEEDCGQAQRCRAAAATAGRE